jgi:hypothetical protein
MLLRYSKDTLLRVIGITLAAMVFLLYLLFHDGYHRDEGLEMSALDTAHASERHHPPTAYATFLTATDANSDDDFYLGLVRLLLFSIKYDPETRDDKGRDFIVITTDLVARKHEELLEREGAIVRHVELLDWAFEGAETPLIERWRHQETKLQIFAQDDYEVIMYMDADHIMLRPWTTLWEEFEAMPVAPLTAHHDSYWQGLMGMDEKEVVLFNGGFLIVRPDRRIFEELLKVTGFIKGYHDQVSRGDTVSLRTALTRSGSGCVGICRLSSTSTLRMREIILGKRSPTANTFGSAQTRQR